MMQTSEIGIETTREPRPASLGADRRNICLTAPGFRVLMQNGSSPITRVGSQFETFPADSGPFVRKIRSLSVPGRRFQNSNSQGLEFPIQPARENTIAVMD